MRFIEHHGVADAVLDAPAEHVLVELVEDQRCKSFLQVVILCLVNANDDRLLALPEAAVRFRQIKKSVIGQFLDAGQQSA